MLVAGVEPARHTHEHVSHANQSFVGLVIPRSAFPYPDYYQVISPH